MTGKDVTDLEVAERLPLLLGLREMVDLFPVAKFTVYRWNTDRDRARQLPAPAVTIAAGSLWTETQVLAFAKRKGLKVDRVVLTRLRKAQGK